MKQKFMLSLFVLSMGLIILASPVYMLATHYGFKGEELVANYVSSNKTSNAKDTILVPSYTFTRNIGPIVQNCTLPMLKYAHGLDTKPQYEKLNLKVGDKCSDFIVSNDPPKERIPLLIIGLIIAAIGGMMMAKSRG